jgi:hypothetical protein
MGMPGRPGPDASAAEIAEYMQEDFEESLVERMKKGLQDGEESEKETEE